MSQYRYLALLRGLLETDPDAAFALPASAERVIGLVTQWTDASLP